MLGPIMHSRFIGSVQIIAAGIGFGFLGVFAKQAFGSGLSIGEVLAFRFTLASMILGMALVLTRRDLLRINRRQLIVCALLGLSGYAVFSTLYFGAIEGVTAALAALLLYTYPAMVACGAHFLFKEKLTRPQILALPLTMMGLLVLLWGETGIQSWSAVAMGLGAAVSYSLYILASSKWQKEIHPVTSAVYVMFFAAGGLALAHRPDFTKVLELPETALGAIAGLAIVCTIGPLTFFLAGLQKLRNAEASILSTVEPVTAAVAGFILLNEPMSALQLMGGGCILAALVLTVVASNPRVATDVSGAPQDPSGNKPSRPNRSQSRAG